jgi:GT2 family glycosyltransferase
MADIAVLILYFEKFNLTVECIKSVVKSGIPVYILNNASSKKGWEKLKSKFKNYSKIKFIHSNINLGPAGGRNRLISESAEEWLFFLDNDIHIETVNWLQVLHKNIDNFKEIESFIPRLYNTHEKTFSHWHKYVINKNEVISIGLSEGENLTNFFPGGASLVNRKVFERLGFYDENLFVLEDLEFPIRALVKNEPVKAVLIEEIVLIHKHIYTRKKEDQKAVLERYNYERNEKAQEYICNKHNIIFNSFWKPWVDKQIFNITKNSTFFKTKNLIKSVIKRIIKTIGR